MSQLNREYKSTIFAMLFSDKEKLKSLCEAVSGEKIDSADDIIINTLSDEDGVQSGIFTRLKNDVSFIFHDTQHLYEHQSTWAENMPIRMLLYYAELIRLEHPLKSLYGSRSVELESPHFVVFYNGTDHSGDCDEMTLSLSGHFVRKEENPAIELRVKVYNINKGHNHELMEACETMRQYSEFVAMSRKALKGLQTKDQKADAMDSVIDRCLKLGILTEFLKENRRVIIMRSILEFDEEAYKEALYDDAHRPIYILVEKGTITPEQAAEASDMTTEEFLSHMTSAGHKPPKTD